MPSVPGHLHSQKQPTGGLLKPHELPNALQCKVFLCLISLLFRARVHRSTCPMLTEKVCDSWLFLDQTKCDKESGENDAGEKTTAETSF